LDAVPKGLPSPASDYTIKQEMADRDLYILPLKFVNQRKRLFFEGPARNTGGQDAFNVARRDLNELGDESPDFEEFIGRVIGHFSFFGFTRVAH